MLSVVMLNAVMLSVVVIACGMHSKESMHSITTKTIWHLA